MLQTTLSVDAEEDVTDTIAHPEKKKKLDFD